MLSAKPLSVAPERIQDIKAERTIIAGREVWNRTTARVAVLPAGGARR